jgi:hypothetical protein
LRAIVKAPVSILEVAIIITAKSLENTRKMATFSKPADARPCSGAGIDFGGVALGSPDDRSKTIPAP